MEKPEAGKPAVQLSRLQKRGGINANLYTQIHRMKRKSWDEGELQRESSVDRLK